MKSGTMWRQVGWFVALWALGVGAVALLAYGLRLIIGA